MATADELQRELALADAGFAGDQHAEAEHIHEHAVALDGFCQQLREVAREALDHARRGQGRSEERCVGARRGLHQRRGRRDAIGDDDRRRMRFKQALGEAGDDGGLVGADDLDRVRMREVEVADQRGCGHRLAAHGRAAFPPGHPGERERLAVVLMQPRDVDLQHPVARRL